MTVFGWDASHYDGPLSPSILARARSEGIVFFTHKLAEGLQDTEGTRDDTALAAARSAGIPFVGGYVIPRTLDSVAQVDYWWQVLNASEPWWRDFDGWFNQVDLERWSYDAVSAAKGIDCAKRWRDRTGRQTILYASHGQYWDQLAAWDGPIWNADYVSAPAAGFAAMYPGDDWQATHKGWSGGWAPYSGREPVILQYTSSATIAGLTTCDANAYRGSLDEFSALIGGTDMDAMQAVMLENNWHVLEGLRGGSATVKQNTGTDATGAIQDFPLFPVAKLNEISTAVEALAQAATSAGQPTQDQVDAAVLKAMQDPAVQDGIAAHIAAHLQIKGV